MLENKTQWYCDTHEKRKIELQKYLEENKTLDKMVENTIGIKN